MIIEVHFKYFITLFFTSTVREARDLNTKTVMETKLDLKVPNTAMSPCKITSWLGVVSMKEDGWCKHFDHNTRSCGIYEERPEFCRVKTRLGLWIFEGCFRKDE